MQTIEAGTKVIITNADTHETYKNGDVYTVKSSANGLGVEVDVQGRERYLASWEFEVYTEPETVQPRKIEFADIKEGDLIKAEYTYGGAKRIAEGVVGKHYARSGGLWTTSEGGTVADNVWNATYTLLERSEPPKPNPFAEANVGSLALENDGYVWLKSAANKWQFIRRFDDRIGELSDFVRNDAQMNMDTFKITHNA